MVVEHVFCPKFTYYGQILGLNQYEGKRGTVISGREFHLKHERTNLRFLPMNLKGKKLVALHFYSKKYNFSGKIDEAVETSKEIILIERKYSDNPIIGATMKAQLGLLSILLEENIHKPVKQAIVIFSKKKRQVLEIKIDQEMKRYSLKMLKETMNIIFSGINSSAKFDDRCLNCCFRKVCPVGSLNSM